MFCSKCGNEVADGSAFCHKCGAEIHNEEASETTAMIDPLSGEADGGGSGICCPTCSSGKVQIIVENNTTATGGGYSGGKGCLGFLLFGPLGLLCGSCGKSQRLSSTSETFWVCQNCGNKFKPARPMTMEEKKAAELGSLIGIVIVCLLIGIPCAGVGLLGIYAIILSIVRLDFSNLGMSVLLAVLLSLVGFGLIYAAILSIKNYIAQKNQNSENHHE